MTDDLAMDGRYYAENGKVWKAPIATKTETGQSISIGFPVCTMHDAAGAEAAATVAALMNIGARAQWQPIETAPKGDLIDIWIRLSDGTGTRWCDCYYDQICNDWRTSRPGGKLVWVPARAVTHWMRAPEPPK